jgi:iron(III) transport system permease protein
VSRISGLAARLILALALIAIVGWPAIATVREAARARASNSGGLPATGASLDKVGSTTILEKSGGMPRPVWLAIETVSLVAVTEIIALPLGIALAFFLCRTDMWGRGLLLAVIGLSAFVPLPLHATAWLGALGNVGRAQVFGIRPLLVGLPGAAFVHALAALPWVVLIVAVGLSAVEPELEESALLDHGRVRVLLRVTLRRAIGTIVAAALAVAVLTAGDMTVTDLLQIRTYAEEVYLQYSLGRGPGAAAAVALPPLLVLGVLIVMTARGLGHLDPGRLVSSFQRAKPWPLGRWRVPCGAVLMGLMGNAVALPIYSLVWRAGRVGGRATLGQPPVWSASGLLGTLRYAGDEIWEPLKASLVWTAAAATLTVVLACALAWVSRRSPVWRIIALGLLALTLAAPGPVAGMALVLGYRAWPAVYDSPVMIIMAETLRTLPYSLLLLWPFLRSFPQDYLDACALDGNGPWGQFFRVVLPMSRRPLLAAWAIAFAIGLGELPATNMAAPPGTQPMSVFIWGLLHTGVESHLSGVALIMLMVVATAGLFAAATVRSLSNTDRG